MSRESRTRLVQVIDQFIDFHRRFSNDQSVKVIGVLLHICFNCMDSPDIIHHLVPQYVHLTVCTSHLSQNL